MPDNLTRSKLTWSLLFIIASTCELPAVRAELPQEAREMLDSFPEKKITLDLVISRAILYSDSFRQVQAQLEGAIAPAVQARAPMDLVFEADGGRTENKNRPTNPDFQASEQYINQFSLGLKSYLPTGTAASVKFTHGLTDLRFNSVFIPAPIVAYESRIAFEFSQSLLKDFFGYGIRKGWTAGDESARAAVEGYKESVQEWMFQLIQVYYSAWLAQSQAKSAEENIQRRERLLSITRLKQRRGTAERPDVLQVQNAMALTRLQATKARQDLGDQWRGLVSNLKLPDSFMSIDPLEIPMSIDDPSRPAFEACGTDPLATLPKDTAQIRRATHAMAAAEASASRAANARLPDLQAFALFSGNDVSRTEYSASFQEAFTFRYPAWTLGLRVSFPILGFQARAEQIQGNSQLIRADAEMSGAYSDLKLAWINNCVALQRLKGDVELQEANYNDQVERARLEERRFDLGRSTLTQVIQAQDDASSADLALRGSQVQLRIAAWTVRKLHDGMESYRTHLEELVQKEKAR